MQVHPSPVWLDAAVDAARVHAAAGRFPQEQLEALLSALADMRAYTGPGEHTLRSFLHAAVAAAPDSAVVAAFYRLLLDGGLQGGQAGEGTAGDGRREAGAGATVASEGRRQAGEERQGGGAPPGQHAVRRGGGGGGGFSSSRQPREGRAAVDDGGDGGGGGGDDGGGGAAGRGRDSRAGAARRGVPAGVPVRRAWGGRRPPVAAEGDG